MMEITWKHWIFKRKKRNLTDLVIISGEEVWFSRWKHKSNNSIKDDFKNTFE